MSANKESKANTPAKQAGSTRGGKTKFKKGQSGNPSGRPKESISLKQMLIRRLKMKGEDGKLIGESILDVGIQRALSGSENMIKDIQDRVDGKPAQAVDVTSGGEKINSVDEVIAEVEARLKTKSS